MRKLPSVYRVASEVRNARVANGPIVALETTVVTHGLPKPENLKLARDMENMVRAKGAIPATIGVLNGLIHVGINQEQLEELASAAPLRKISRRDFSFAISRQESGGTTVAGTLIAAHTTGIRVMATGGIGGVHRNAPFDISADLQELSRTPVVVVCSGAKSILDLPATLEVLETLGVPVVGYQTDQFPAFYARSSGLPVNMCAASPKDVANIADAHWKLGLSSAVLVVVPIPADDALSEIEMESVVEQALVEAKDKKISGQNVTPFLLNRVSELTGQASLRANLALLLNNGRVAAEIACAYHRKYKKVIA
ncbi:pseudouridine-5'-phosphate glycosidase [Chloroflexota bacterium]